MVSAIASAADVAALPSPSTTWSTASTRDDGELRRVEIATAISDPRLVGLTPLAAVGGPKTRVGGLNLRAQARVGGQGGRSGGPDWAFRDEGRRTASAISKFENWNRFYDPSVGRYLSPDPLLRAVITSTGSGPRHAACSPCPPV